MKSTDTFNEVGLICYLYKKNLISVWCYMDNFFYLMRWPFSQVYLINLFTDMHGIQYLGLVNIFVFVNAL